MKFFYSLIITCLSILGYSQTILYQSESTSRTVQDPQTVVLAQGFHASSTTSNPFVAKIGPSADNPGGGPVDSNAGVNNPSGTAEPVDYKFHDTKGNIEVTGSGQLQFTLPIALPPGVKSVAPQVNLVYTGGAGNGIAGYGWNISGTTAISRVGKNIEKDGKSEGIQLDYSDYYSFNGQRLILKSGEYGKDDAEYVTEKYSNIKIKSIGSITGEMWQGPEYWEVTFEDGSQAWYGGISTTDNNTARTPLDYNIVKWRDTKGNYITYNYLQSDHVACTSSIKWGGNEPLNKAHFNEIKFNYFNERALKEINYLKGLEFIQNKLLKDITVQSNGSQFKRYAIEYDNNGTIYEFAKKITEYNANDAPANPIAIEYEVSQAGNEETVKENNITTTNTKKYGDFDMDGITDYLEFIPTPGTAGSTPVGVINFKGSVYKNVTMIPLQYELNKFTTAEFAKAAAVTFKKDGFIKNKAGIVIPHKVTTSNPNKPSYELLVYSVDISAFKFQLEYSKVISYDQYSPGDDIGESGCTYLAVNLSDLISYDYNGDGISELLFSFSKRKRCVNLDPILSKNILESDSSNISAANDSQLIKPQVTSLNTEYGDTSPDSDFINTEVNFIPLGGGASITNYYSSILFNLDENTNVNQSIYKYDEGQGVAKKIQLADFNGDGIQDIIWMGPSNGLLSKVFNIYKQTDGNYTTTNVENFSGQILGGFFNGALYGDFNGDAKIDVLVPQANKSYNWNLYLSDGKKFNQYFIDNFIFYSTETELLSSGVHNTNFESGCTYGLSRYFQYNTGDLDGDGKSEVLVSNVLVYDHKWNAHHDKEWTNVSVAVYSVNKLSGSTNKSIVYNPPYSLPFGGSTPEPFNIENTNSIQTNSNINFYRTRYWLKAFNEKVIPFSTLTLNRDNQQIILVGKPDDCAGVVGCTYNYVLQYNYPYIPLISRAKSFQQGGTAIEIAYKELDSKNNSSFYKPIRKEQYPYFELDQIPLSAAVSQLKQYTSAGTLLQDFRYRGFLSHFTGKGMIGFRQTSRSSWYANGFENTKIWSGAEIDPINEGVPVKEWSIRTNDENLIFPTDISENNTQLLSFKSTTYQTDKLLNGQAVATVSAADKPKIVTALTPKSTKTKDFLTGTITNSTVTYGDYYLPVQSISNVNNGYAITTSDLEYLHNPSGTGSDYFIGRPKSKTDKVQAYGDTKSAKEEYIYENNQLKTLKTWNRDNTGSLQETYTYDGFGNIIEKITGNSIDSQAQTTKAAYDSKGRFVIKKTDNLGLETNITYNDWGQLLTQTDPLGNTLTNTYDNWGKVLKSKTNLGGTTTYQYEKDSNSNVIVTQYDPDGDVSKTYTNTLGQNYKSSTKAFKQGQFIAKEIQYDLLGRKTKESEPYFDGQSPSQWNVITYNDTFYPAKITATALATLNSAGEISSFLGKQVETSVSGNTTTVREVNGYARTNTKTTDALGNVVSTTDKGGTILFSYNAAGEQIKAQYAENIVTTKYDIWGRKSEFNDPSNGLYKYEYDGFGQSTKTISPKGTKEYTYNNTGQLISQKETSTTDGGQATKKEISYLYDNKGRIISKSGTSKGQAYSSNVSYDPQGRLLSSSESSNGKYFIQKGITYDDKARVISYEKQLYSSGTLTKVTVENRYSDWNGELTQVKDKVTGKSLWELKETNAKGQVLQAKLGAANVTNGYDGSGFLTTVNHSSQVKPGILQLTYAFDGIKNELKSRATGGDFNIVETFDYDDNNRLVNWTNPVTGVKVANAARNVYDAKGRIIENDQVGKIKFENSAKIYQPTGMTLNAAGEQNYNNDLIQSIAYNENNDPVFIDGQKGDVAFQYGLTSMRQKVSYGGNFDPGQEGKFTKFYSEDGSFEVVKNNTTGKEKHILYIGGNPYESNIVYLKDFAESSGSFKFLHKDYIGSILAISDEAGNKLEQRHFDAWGNFTHLQIGNGAIITDKNIIDNSSLLLERGYTSHEHFAEVGIIHMNGRLYDPLLRRFLNADENIQDMFNTQIYNKYGYVMNNPLMYNDPSGEIFGLIPIASALIIGAIIGASSYVVSALITGQSITLAGLFKSTLFGSISGAVTFGVGSIFSSTVGATTQFAKSLGEVGTAFVQASAHGIAQGTLSLMQGESFHQALISGALGSLGAAAFGAVAKDVANQAGGQILFGAIAGGVGAELSGGNFWQGALIGGIVAGFNHVMHSGDMQPDNGYDKNGKKVNNNGGDTTDYRYDDNGNVISSTSVKISTYQGGEVSSNTEGYGYRMRTIGSGGALYDPSMDMFQLYVGGGELKAGYGLLKMGVTNLSKVKLGIPILGKASKTVLESSLHYSKIYGYKKINLFGGAIKKLPYFTGVKAGFVRNWASFYGRNAVWFGGARAGVGNGLIYNGTHK